MQRQSLDLWMEGKSPTETFDSLSETHDAFTNETYIELINTNMRTNNDGLEFYYFKLLVDKLPIYLTPKDLQSYLIDFVTNEPKYGTQMVPLGWMTFGNYVNNITTLNLPLAAPILYDIFNMISWTDVDVFDKKTFNWREDVTDIRDSYVFRDFKLSPNLWLLFNRQLAQSSHQCLMSLNKSHSSGCKYRNDTFNKVDFNEDVKIFLENARQPAHFNENGSNYNYPMIPFCWFGGPNKWLGGINTTTDYNWYNKIVGVRDPTLLLQWCNVFEEAFPIYPNCYTVNNAIGESTSSKDF
jgi:hypothetical protein